MSGPDFNAMSQPQVPGNIVTILGEFQTQVVAIIYNKKPVRIEGGAPSPEKVTIWFSDESVDVVNMFDLKLELDKMLAKLKGAGNG